MITKLMKLVLKSFKPKETSLVEAVQIKSNKELSMENQLQLIVAGHASHPYVTKEALDTAQLALRLRYMTITSQELDIYPQETLENLYILWNFTFDRIPAERQHIL